MMPNTQKQPVALRCWLTRRSEMPTKEDMSVVLALTLTFIGVSLAVVELVLFVVSSIQIGWAS